MKQIVSIVALAIGVVAMLMSWQANQSLLDQCVTVEDLRTSSNHTLRTISILTGERFLPPREISEFYKTKLQCLVDNSVFGVSTADEYSEFESLRYVTNFTIKDSGLCADLVSGQTICSK